MLMGYKENTKEIQWKHKGDAEEIQGEHSETTKVKQRCFNLMINQFSPGRPK